MVLCQKIQLKPPLASNRIPKLGKRDHATVMQRLQNRGQPCRKTDKHSGKYIDDLTKEFPNIDISMKNQSPLWWWLRKISAGHLWPKVF